MKFIKTVKIMLFTLPLVLSLLAVKPNNAVALEPFIGQIIMFAGNFAPRGWALCDGQLLPIAQNTALFSILGTTYGGDGRTTFGLPDLRGRVTIHAGTGPGLSNKRLGQRSGAETQTLTINQLPSHNHLMNVHPTEATNSLPVDGYLGKTGDGAPDFYHSSNGAPTGQLASGAIQATGGGQAVSIMQPYNTVNYIIALVGVYPSRD
jgi:microcystin-dependent protein